MEIKYGRKLITHTSAAIWNSLAKQVFTDIDMIALSRKRLTKIVPDHSLSTYTNIDDKEHTVILQ